MGDSARVRTYQARRRSRPGPGIGTGACSLSRCVIVVAVISLQNTIVANAAHMVGDLYTTHMVSRMYTLFRTTGTTKLLWRKLGTAMHRGSSAPGVRAALVCAGPVLVGLAQVQLARQQEYAADRAAVRQPVHYDLSIIRRQFLSIFFSCACLCYVMSRALVDLKWNAAGRALDTACVGEPVHAGQLSRSS